MANPNIQIDVGGNTARLKRDIDKVANTPIAIDLKSGKTGSNAPLGRITGDVAEIDKSLAAANARVVAFAASASVIYGLEAAVRALAQTFVNVEKRLADVNVLLNLSASQLDSFGGSLFSIAASTAQSFDTVAEAATELARQGLGVEETLKRTSDALILTRLSGLNAADSVKAVTAAINSFTDAGLQSSDVINKLANVDAGFAVSSADLANAISRVGSSASDAGVSFDELIALVTTAQQVTSRGGSVIGNSLKTIFTRLGRGQTQDLLQSLGVSLTDQSGNLKNQVQLLQDLAKIYDTLPQLQKNQVAEQVGGVFQINVLKAALGDLGKEYSIYNQALQTSINSTDQAILRNEQLNQTLSARGAASLAKIQQAGATIAEPIFKPIATNVLNISDILTNAVNSADASGIGAKIGMGLLQGLGSFIGGPGLALITAALGKLVAQFSKVGAEAFKSVLGTNTAAKEQAAIQANVAKFLQQNAGLYSGIEKGQVSVTSAAQKYLSTIQQQTQALQQQAAIAQQIASIVGKGLTIQKAGGGQIVTPRGTRLSSGFIPNFGDPNVSAEIAGAMKHGYKPGKVVKERMYDGNGKSFLGYRNLAETRTDFINSSGKKATMITPPNGFSKDTLTAYSGFIPNFALLQNMKLSEINKMVSGKSFQQAIQSGTLTQEQRQILARKQQLESKQNKNININLNKFGVGSKYGVLLAQSGDGATKFSQPIAGPDSPKRLKPLADAGIRGQIIAGLRYRSIYPPNASDIKSAEGSYSAKIDQFLQSGFDSLAQDIASNLGGAVAGKPEKVSSILPPGAKGTIFEKAVSAATKKPGPKMDNNLDDRAAFDFDPISGYPLLNKLFGKKLSGAVEAKIGMNAARNLPSKILNKEPSIAKSIFQEYLPKEQKRRYFSGFIPNFALNKARPDMGGRNAFQINWIKELAKKRGVNLNDPIAVFKLGAEFAKKYSNQQMMFGFSSGLIPNFANNLKDAINKEKLAGVPASSIYVSQEKELSKANPLGIGVFNKRDEPNKNARKFAMSARGFSSGFVPNFANETDFDTGSNMSSTFSMASTSLMMAMAYMGMNADKTGTSLKDLARDVKEGRGEFLKTLSIDIKDFDPAKNAQNIQNASKNIENVTKILQSPVVTYSSRVSAFEDYLDKQQKIIKSQQMQQKAFKYQEALRSKGIGYGFAGQALGGVAAQFLGGPETKGGALATAGGNIAGFAGMGAMFGIKGAAIGAIVGGITSIPDVAKSFNDNLRSATLAASNATQSLNDFQTGSQKFLQASSALSELQTRTDFVPPSKIEKAQEDYYLALSELPVAVQQEIKNFRGTDAQKTQEIIAKNNAELTKNAEIAALSQKSAEKLGGWFSEDAKIAERVGKGLSGLLGVGDNAKTLKDKLNQYNAAISKTEEAQKELSGGIFGLKNKIESYMPSFLKDRIEFQLGQNVGRKLGDMLPIPTEGSESREILKKTVEDIAAAGGEIPQAIKDFVENGLGSASAGEIRAVTAGLNESFKNQIKKIESALADQEAANAAAQSLPEAAQKYINNIARAVEQSSLDAFLNLDINRKNQVDAPKFGLEIRKLGEDFLGQFKNYSNFIPKIDPFKRVEKDLKISQKGVQLSGVESFVTDFIPALNNEFLNLVANKAITGSDIINVQSGLEKLKETISNASSLNDLSVDGDFSSFMSDFYSRQSFLPSGAGMDPLIGNENLNKAFQDAISKAANKVRSDMSSLDFEAQKAKVQAGLSSAMDKFQQAMSNLDMLPRADLSGFVNPFKQAQNSRNDLVNQYNEAYADIQDQFQSALAGADPSSLAQLADQRDEAIQKLNENFNKSIRDLNDQVNALQESSAREAINFAVAGGASPEVINSAINKYISSIQDRIKEYANYLGVSTGEVEKLMRQKLQKDVGMIPDGFGGLVEEIKKWMAEATKVNANAESAGEGLTKLINAAPSTAEALQSLSNSAGSVAQALSNAAGQINSLNFNPQPNQPTNKAKGYIPNFASPKASNINQIKRLEKNVSGKTPRFYKDPFPHVRNSTQPTFKSAMRDHGGLKNAIQDSINMQSNFARGFIPNFSAVNENLGEAQADEKNKKYFNKLKNIERFGKAFKFEILDIPNFALPTIPGMPKGDAPAYFKQAFASIQQVVAVLSRNAGFSSGQYRNAETIDWNSNTQGRGGAGAMVMDGKNVWFNKNERTSGFLLGAMANEATHVNQGRFDESAINTSLSAIKKISNFLRSKGMLFGGDDSTDSGNVVYNFKTSAEENRRKINEFTRMADAKFSESSKLETEKAASNIKNLVAEMNTALLEAERNVKKEAEKEVKDASRSISNSFQDIKSKFANSVYELSRSSRGGLIGSEDRYQKNSPRYIRERESSLMNGIVAGIQRKNISANDLLGVKLAKDSKEANWIVGSILQTDQDLRNRGIQTAMGFIPNFANKDLAKLREKMAAKEHGYISGQVNEKRLWNGSGQSMQATVNSAEKIVDFRNSRGYKATMVMPPNGFAGGFMPDMQVEEKNKNNNLLKNPSDSVDNFNSSMLMASQETAYFADSTKNFSNDTEIMTKSVKDAVSAINSFADTAASFNVDNFNPEINIPQPQVNVAPANITVEPNISSNVTLSNPIVTPTFNLSVDGLGNIDSSISEIKNTLVSTIQSQASRIDFLSQQLRDLKFTVAKRSI